MKNLVKSDRSSYCVDTNTLVVYRILRKNGTTTESRLADNDLTRVFVLRQYLRENPNASPVGYAGNTSFGTGRHR